MGDSRVNLQGLDARDSVGGRDDSHDSGDDSVGERDAEPRSWVWQWAEGNSCCTCALVALPMLVGMGLAFWYGYPKFLVRGLPGLPVSLPLLNVLAS